MEYELPWSGEPFRDAAFIAFDTETAVYDPDGREYDLSREIPPLVLATVSDGTRHAVLRPDQLLPFVNYHQDTLIVGHNTAFDYWTVHKTLGEEKGNGWQWAGRAAYGLMDDTMLLDFLVRLADPAANTMDGMRNLGQLARMVGMEADKESPYRLRFGELIGQDWNRADRGFFDYAVQDTVVTWHVYKYLLEKATLLSQRADVCSLIYYEHGPLTSKLQTRASIVLAEIGRNGMAVDRTKLHAVREQLNRDIDEQTDYLATLDPPLFRYYVRDPRTGVRKVNRRTGVPNLIAGNLTVHLAKAAEVAGKDVARLPRTPKGDKLSTKLDVWRNLLPDDPLVRSWGTMADKAKLLQFVVQLDGKEAVYPRYRTLVRTGRTSCVQPNVQQMPRERWFRELFVSRPGYVFVITDYSTIELVTLAAVLFDRYGESLLADVLREGVCPHSYTASMVLGLPYEEVAAGVKAEKQAGLPATYSKARQAAKAINFGVPGGLGARRLAAYAKTNYGVDMTEEEARDLRNKLVYDVYPELEAYLEADIFDTLAANLRCDRWDIGSLVTHGFNQWNTDCVVKWGGRTTDGTSIPVEAQGIVWDTLAKYNRNPDLSTAIEEWDGRHRGIAFETVTTLTGRIRAGADYGEARNTPFQGLAADGAKVALWNLHTAGFKIVAFIHDEVVCEVPEVGADVLKADIETIMKDSMASVLQCDIPVRVESVISRTWTK